MKAVLFSAKQGQITVEDIPAPQLNHGCVLIRNQFSLISAGTERARLEVGHQSLIGKARKRPDQVRQVLDTVRRLGPAETYRIVSDRLAAPSLVGYSSSGVVTRIGEG